MHSCFNFSVRTCWWFNEKVDLNEDYFNIDLDLKIANLNHDESVKFSWIYSEVEIDNKILRKGISLYLIRIIHYAEYERWASEIVQLIKEFKLNNPLISNYSWNKFWQSKIIQRERWNLSNYDYCHQKWLISKIFELTYSVKLDDGWK